jgi:hypothetical protein
MAFAKGDKTLKVKISVSGDITSDPTNISYTQELRVFEENSIFNQRLRLTDGDWVNLIPGDLTMSEMRTKDDDYMFGNLLVVIKNLSETNPKSLGQTMDSLYNMRYPVVNLYSGCTADGRTVNGSANSLSGGPNGIIAQIEPGNSLATHLRVTHSAYVAPTFSPSSAFSYVDIEYSIIVVGR